MVFRHSGGWAVSTVLLRIVRTATAAFNLAALMNLKGVGVLI